MIAGCQTIDFENNESLLEDGVIRYPSSKWKERATQELQFKSIALQTEPKPKFDTNFHIIGSSSNEEVDDIVEIDGERPPCDKNHEKNGSNLVLEENMKRLNIKVCSKFINYFDDLMSQKLLVLLFIYQIKVSNKWLFPRMR
jgi:hypothetical protein